MTVISPKQFSSNEAIRRAKARDAAKRHRDVANRAVIDDCMQWALTAMAMSGLLLLLQGLLRSAVAPSAAGRLVDHALLIGAGLLALGAAFGVARGLSHAARRAVLPSPSGDDAEAPPTPAALAAVVRDAHRR